MQKADYEQLKAAAEARNEKINEYIKRAIKERMDRERNPGVGSGFREGAGDSQ